MTSPTTDATVQRDVIVGSRVGLHARPAAAIAKAAAGLATPVQIAVRGGEPVPAASLLSLLSLGAAHGDTVTLSATGDEAPDAVEILADLIARDLDAEV